MNHETRCGEHTKKPSWRKAKLVCVDCEKAQKKKIIEAIVALRKFAYHDVNCICMHIRDECACGYVTARDLATSVLTELEWENAK